MARENVVTVIAGLRKFRRDDFTVFTIEGDNSLPFQQAIRDAVQAESGDIALHIRKLRMISSGFVGLLMFLYKEVSRRGRRFVLLNPNLRLRDLILVMGLNQELTILTTVEDLPATTLGLTLHDEGQIAPGLAGYRLDDLRILSIGGPVDGATIERVAEIVADEPANLVLHVGPFEGGESASLFDRLSEIQSQGRRPGRDLPYLNPSIEFHDRLRKAGVEQRVAIVTALDQLVGP